MLNAVAGREIADTDAGYTYWFHATRAKDMASFRAGSRTFALVLMLDLHGLCWLRGQCRMQAATCLDAGLFVGRDDKFVFMQLLSLPLLLVEIQNPAGFEGKLRIAWKNPTAMLPGTNGVLMQPSPERGVAQLGDQTALADVLS